MEITKVELKILIKEFLTASNRVLRAGFEIYCSELDKFLTFLDTHQLISDYIQSCGEPEFDVEQEYAEVSKYGNALFELGSTPENEVANIYAVLKCMVSHNVSGRDFVFYGYSDSKKYQDKVNGFGNEYIRVLISHIDNYLTRISIQMGIDEKTTVNVSIAHSNLSNSQVSVTGCGNITATQQLTDMDKLSALIAALMKEAEALNNEDRETVQECVEVIQTIQDEKPKKGMIKTALATLKGIKGTVEFAAAVAGIAQFVMCVICYAGISKGNGVQPTAAEECDLCQVQNGQCGEGEI